jgi:1,4-dihydroxy-2-naphthoate octaprenyltransferase
MVSLKGVLGALGIQTMTVGLYPLTQVYQYQEDIQKDRTLSVSLGISATFQFAMAFIALSGLFLATMVYLFFSKLQSLGIVVYIAILLWKIRKWAEEFKVEDIHYNFKILHSINFVNSACFFGFTVGHLTGVLKYI